MLLEKLNLPAEQLLQIQIWIRLYIFYSKVIFLFQNPFYPLNTSSELHDDPFVIKRLSSKDSNAVKTIQIQLQTEEVKPNVKTVICDLKTILKVCFRQKVVKYSLTR